MDIDKYLPYIVGGFVLGVAAGWLTMLWVISGHASTDEEHKVIEVDFGPYRA